MVCGAERLHGGRQIATGRLVGARIEARGRSQRGLVCALGLEDDVTFGGENMLLLSRPYQTSYMHCE